MTDWLKRDQLAHLSLALLHQRHRNQNAECHLLAVHPLNGGVFRFPGMHTVLTAHPAARRAGHTAAVDNRFHDLVYRFSRSTSLARMVRRFAVTQNSVVGPFRNCDGRAGGEDIIEAEYAFSTAA